MLWVVVLLGVRNVIKNGRGKMAIILDLLKIQLYQENAEVKNIFARVAKYGTNMVFFHREKVKNTHFYSKMA